MRPYIGVTGFMSAKEVDSVAAAMVGGAHRDLMVGVLVSSKTLRRIPNKWPGRFPHVSRVAEIFKCRPGHLNLIHYSTDEAETLTDQLEELLAIGGPHLHGFQLNIRWPNPHELWVFRQHHPHLRIVLQVGEKAMLDKTPALVALAIGGYESAVDAVLIDPSGGVGKPFDVDFALRTLKEIRKISSIGIGVAGGLSSGASLEAVAQLAKEFPDLSIDAEGRLRTPQPEDALDLAKATSYVRDACTMFS